MTTDAKPLIEVAAAEEKSPEELELAARHKLNAAVSRVMNAGAPPHFATAIAVESIARLLLAKGVVTLLELLEDQAAFADESYTNALRAKITQDVANGIVRPN